MKKNNVTIFIAICLALTFNNVNSQNIENIAHFGDSLFLIKENLAALNEYQRAFFFEHNNEKKTILSNKIADCYLAAGDYDRAKAFYDTAFLFSMTDSGKLESKLNNILCLILKKEFGYALLKLNMLETSLNQSQNHKKTLYQGICNFGLEQYDEAFDFFYKSLDENDSTSILHLELLFENRKTLMRPYPALASTMSIFMPGSGQMYAGNFFDGVNSIVLLSSLTCIVLYTPVLGFSIIFPLFYRYYMGGILNANELAKEKRKEKQSLCYKELMEIFPGDSYLDDLFSFKRDVHNYNKYFKNSVSKENIFLSLSFLFYKKYLSSQDVDACIFNPSCSVYTIESVQKNGAVKGLLDGFDRILRCHPFANEHDYPHNSFTNKYYDAF